jgi:hypothetical protein
MPSGEGVGFDDDKRLSPIKQPGEKNHGEPSGVVGAAGFPLALLVKRQLLAEKQVLRGETAPATEEIPAKSDGVEQKGGKI